MTKCNSIGLILLSSFAVGAANTAQASSDTFIQLEAEMLSCGYLEDTSKIYTRCLQVNHPNVQNGSHDRWTQRGEICTELANQYNAPVWYRQDVANQTDQELAQSSCVDNHAYFSLDFQSKLEAEMLSCDYLEDTSKIYTRCLQVNHPNFQDGSHDRWILRGEICTELANQHNAPVSYQQDVANQTDQELAQSSCLDNQSYFTDDFQYKLEAEMDACDYLEDTSKIYTRCLQVNHPNFQDGSHDRWILRGEICTELANQYNAPVWYRQDVANQTDQELAQSQCNDLGSDLSPGELVFIEGVAFGTQFHQSSGGLKAIASGGSATAIQLVKINGSGDLKFGDLIALHFEDGSFATAMDGSENHNIVARAKHLHQWEIFKIVDLNGQSSNQTVTEETPFAILTAHGKYVSVTPSGEVFARVTHIKGWEEFTMKSALSPSGTGLQVDYGSTSGAFNEGDVVGAYASAGASVEYGTSLDLGNGVSLTSTIGASAEAQANVCAGLNPKECAGVYASAETSAGVYATDELDIDSDVGKINFCAGSMAGVEATAEGGAVINGDGATAGAAGEMGASVGSEMCAGVTGHYGSIDGKAGVTVGPAVSAGMQVSFNFDGCTWSASMDGEVHVLVGIELEGNGGINFCHVGEEVAELASDIWYDVMDGQAVQEWTVGAADDVAQWTVGAANDMADWTTGAANDVGDWTVGAANDVADWTEGAAYDVADWTEGAIYDVGDWTVGAANDAVDWTEGAVNDAVDWLEGAGGSVVSFFGSLF